MLEPHMELWWVLNCQACVITPLRFGMSAPTPSPSVRPLKRVGMIPGNEDRQDCQNNTADKDKLILCRPMGTG